MVNTNRPTQTMIMKSTFDPFTAEGIFGFSNGKGLKIPQARADLKAYAFIRGLESIETIANKQDTKDQHLSRTTNYRTYGGTKPTI